jgi:hypothetical protein
MRLVAFLSESEESTKAKRIIEVVAALYPELQVEYLPFPSPEAELHSVSKAPAVFIEGRKAFEGSFTREQLLAEIRMLRPPVSHVLGEPKPEREEAFE